jgi:alcohol dehydrogenase (cytochrome c)/quinohemoprotein ethanol dehydrogenase
LANESNQRNHVLEKSLWAGLGFAVAVSWSFAAESPTSGWVTAERLLAAHRDADNWLSVGRDYGETRFSPLTRIDANNVKRLGLAWFYDLDTHRGQEATPVVVDGVMYTSSAWSKVLAFKAATGELLWEFDPKVSGEVAIHVCCDLVNRGVAVWRGRVYVGTLDGRLIALDARTGEPVWSVLTVDPTRPYAISGAPIVVAGKVVIGNAGAEFGVRGYVTAYDCATGRQAWRFYTVPGDPSKGFETKALERASRTWSGEWWHDGGGATVWNSLSYDPELDLIYFGTGNASPWGRPSGGGDNLYSASVVAVNAATGIYAWHYQTTPGDAWDYDADQTLTLATLTLHGRVRRVIMQAAKNGFFYVLDRRTGELLSAKKYVPVNWASGVDLKSGRPLVNPEALYARTGKVWVSAPGALGAHNWQAAAFSPLTGLVYIPAQEAPFPYLRDDKFERTALGMNVGLDMAATSLPPDAGARAAALAGLKGYLLGWDPVQQREVWRAEHAGPWNGGVLATAGNLVFQGTASGELVAYRASDGTKLWSDSVQTGIGAAPMTFAVGGRQYVSVLVGWGGVYPLVAGELAFKSGRMVNRSRVLTYALDGTAQLPALPVADPPAVASVLAGARPEEQLVREGARLYARHCGNCHGDAAVSGGIVPDLRYSHALTNDEFWTAVVHDGVLAARGMVSFKAELSASHEQALRAYLTQRALESREP